MELTKDFLSKVLKNKKIICFTIENREHVAGLDRGNTKPNIFCLRRGKNEHLKRNLDIVTQKIFELLKSNRASFNVGITRYVHKSDRDWIEIS